MSTETDLEDAIRRCDGGAVLEIMRRVRDERRAPQDKSLTCPGCASGAVSAATSLPAGCWTCTRCGAVWRRSEERSPPQTSEDEAAECARDISGRRGYVWYEGDAAVIRAYGNARYAEGLRGRRQAVFLEVAGAWETLNDLDFEKWLYKQVKT